MTWQWHSLGDGVWPFLNRHPVLVCVVLVLLGNWFFRQRGQARERLAEDQFAEAHGCQPMRPIPYELPLSIDLVRRSLRANSQQRLLAEYTQFFDNLGPNLEMTLLGGVSLVTTDPAVVEYVLTNSHDFNFGSRRGAFLRLLGEGVFTQDGKEWKHSREVLRHQFARMQYKNLEGFNRYVEKLVSRIESGGNIVDLQPLFFKFTLDVTTALVFGKSVDSLEDKEEQSFAECFDKASFITAVRARLSDCYWAYTTPAFISACNDVKRYAESYIRETLESASQERDDTDAIKNDFVQKLYEEFGDVTAVRDQLVNLLLAGRDTTACLLSWTFFNLVRHPAVFNRLKAEIATLQDDASPINRSTIQKLHYLDCVLKETLRLYPPVSINVRTASKAMVLPRGGGPTGSAPVLIRKGMGIGWSAYHMQRRKDLYGQDADTFRPERWLSGDAAGSESGGLSGKLGSGYVPFNGGPRLCLGKDFALMETSLAIIRIVQAFPNLGLPDGTTVLPVGQEKQILTLTLSSAEGCLVQLR